MPFISVNHNASILFPNSPNKKMLSNVTVQLIYDMILIFIEDNKACIPSCSSDVIKIKQIH